MKGTLPALMVCVFGVTTGEFVLAGILPGVAADLDVSIPAAGLLVTAYALGMIVGGPLLTAITAGRPRKPLVLALLLVAIAGNLISALAPGYGVLFAARIVTALVTATFFANAIVIAISAAPAGRQASTVAKLAFGMNLAMILGAPLGTWIGDAFGWRATFLAITLTCTAGLLLVARLVPAESWISAVGPGVSRAEIYDSMRARGSALAELRVLRGREVQLAIGITAVANVGLLMVFTYLAPLLTDVGSFTAEAVAPMLLVYGLGATVGNLAGGWLADRALLATQLGALTLLVALFLAWWLSSGTTLTAVLVFATGAVGFSVIPGMQARVMTTAAQAPTLAIAVNASAYQVAAAFAGWLGGRVIAGPGLRTIYLAAALTTVLGIGLSTVAWLRERSVVPVNS
ncbi:DHA1 family inner membrane transport protein [Kribbella steppae]|uniref:DHA1 family inner membrane transport protein n=1 Tax=Kribbella steppae TaxID=2512223 RepID=A0A4R2HHI9_9ACTN|nr:MFS transporter [Kribbella steppae]TCO28369.1 DHA1 family inner membrane transport protein [Kribbella steppae]